MALLLDQSGALMHLPYFTNGRVGSALPPNIRENSSFILLTLSTPKANGLYWLFLLVASAGCVLGVIALIITHVWEKRLNAVTTLLMTLPVRLQQRFGVPLLSRVEVQEDGTPGHYFTAAAAAEALG